MNTASHQAGYGNPETADRILRSAWELIIATGHAGSMSQYAKAAGVSRQALYLHFESRGRLLTALGQFIDERSDLYALADQVTSATSGREALRRMAHTHAQFHAQVIDITRVLDNARHHDPDVAAAWDDRMTMRRGAHRSIAQRLSDEGDMAPEWTVDAATEMLVATSLPRVWDELVVERGWSTAEFERWLVLLWERAFVSG